MINEWHGEATESEQGSFNALDLRNVRKNTNTTAEGGGGKN